VHYRRSPHPLATYTSPHPLSPSTIAVTGRLIQAEIFDEAAGLPFPAFGVAEYGGDHLFSRTRRPRRYRAPLFTARDATPGSGQSSIFTLNAIINAGILDDRLTSHQKCSVRNGFQPRSSLC
jgi:hypothetical protein